MGGGGFSMAPDDAATALDRHVLELCGAESPTVTFVPTASADNDDYVARFRAAFGALGVRTDVLTLWSDARASVERLHEADVVYVGGGSTVNLLSLWRAHGVDAILRDRAQADGVVLAGISAGANCWYHASSTDSYRELAPLRDGLGLLRDAFCPHYLQEPGRAESLRSWVAHGDLPETTACEDGVAAVWRSGAFVEFVSESPGQVGRFVVPDRDRGTATLTVDARFLR